MDPKYETLLKAMDAADHPFVRHIIKQIHEIVGPVYEHSIILENEKQNKNHYYLSFRYNYRFQLSAPLMTELLTLKGYLIDTLWIDPYLDTTMEPGESEVKGEKPVSKYMHGLAIRLKVCRSHLLTSQLVTDNVLLNHNKRKKFDSL